MESGKRDSTLKQALKAKQVNCESGSSRQPDCPGSTACKGKDMSEAIFLERFAALCVDPLFHVRKVCAANFGDFSSVVGMESTEKVLVSHATFSTIAGNSSSSRASKFNVLRRRRMRREAEQRRLEGQNPQILEQLTFKAIFIF